MLNVLVTGSNRGIGFEFTKQYLEKGWNVFACCRNPDNAKDLQGLHDSTQGKLSIFELDVTDARQIANLSNKLKNETIDVFINNAGISGPEWIMLDKLDSAGTEEWLKVFEVNAIAPVLVIKSFIQQIINSDLKTVVAISSIMGSITDNSTGGMYLYRSSKAALNMAFKSLSIDLTEPRVTVVLLHPGWVKTDMGGNEAPLIPKKSVSNMIKVIGKLTFKDNGTFINYDGSALPW